MLMHPLFENPRFESQKLVSPSFPPGRKRLVVRGPPTARLPLLWPSTSDQLQQKGCVRSGGFIDQGRTLAGESPLPILSRSIEVQRR